MGGEGWGKCKPPPSPAEMIFCKEAPLNPSSCWFLGSEDSTQNTALNPLNAALSRFPPHVRRQDLSLEPRAWSQGSCHHVPSTGATTKRHYTWLFMWLLGLELKSSCNLPTEATPHPAPHDAPLPCPPRRPHTPTLFPLPSIVVLGLMPSWCCTEGLGPITSRGRTGSKSQQDLSRLSWYMRCLVAPWHLHPTPPPPPVMIAKVARGRSQMSEALVCLGGPH